MDLAQEQLHRIFSTKPSGIYSREFEELIYTWLRLPRPARLWWMFFKAAFNGEPREMKDYLERSVDPRAKEALEVLRWVTDGPWPVGPMAPFYISVWGWRTMS